MVEKRKEPWAKKQQRLASSSPFTRLEPTWELRSFIVKSNDDLRQEVFIMQMIKYFRSIWPQSVWLNFYHILATGPDTGLIETIIASADLDALKRRDGYTSCAISSSSATARRTRPASSRRRRSSLRRSRPTRSSCGCCCCAIGTTAT